MTDRKLRTTPLKRTIPRSAPIPNFIKTSARKPNTVVAALAAIAENARFIAMPMAFWISSVCFRYSSKLRSRKMA